MSIVEMFGLDETFKNTYFVDDCFGSDAVKVLFILESPYTDELRYKYPAAGKTGDIMAQVLLENYMCSFGELIHRGDPSTKPYGIVNVAQIPLQLTAYQKKDKSHPALVAMSRIKNYAGRPYDVELHKAEIKRAAASRPVIRQLFNNFSYRLKTAVKAHRPKLVIPCGVFAQGFFEALQNNPPVLGNSFAASLEGHTFKVFYMYHPSPKSGESSSWVTKKKVVENLKKEIADALNR